MRSDPPEAGPGDAEAGARRPFAAPRLLAISDRATLTVPFVAWLGTLAGAGVDAVQLREKDLSDRDLFDLAVMARETLPDSTRLLVNGRPDVALAAGADGVHLPAAGLPVRAVRVRFGDRLAIGRSTHSLDEVRRAKEDGADYVTFGPVYDTPSKRRYGPPVGLALLRQAATTDLPLVALGGVMIDRLGELAAAGAAGAAGIRQFQEPASLPRLVATARRAFARAAASG